MSGSRVHVVRRSGDQFIVTSVLPFANESVEGGPLHEVQATRTSDGRQTYWLATPEQCRENGWLDRAVVLEGTTVPLSYVRMDPLTWNGWLVPICTAEQVADFIARLDSRIFDEVYLRVHDAALVVTRRRGVRDDGDVWPNRDGLYALSGWRWAYGSFASETDQT